VHQLRGPAARAAREVRLIDEPNPVTPARGVQRHAGACDSSSYDEHIDPGGQCMKVLVA
jgi:hypothetical protein